MDMKISDLAGLGKLTEFLLSKGVGGLLIPWQKKRVSKADLEIFEQTELKKLQIEQITDKVRSGNYVIKEKDGKLIAEDKENNAHAIKNVLTVKNKQMDSDILPIIIRNDLRDTIRKEVNIAKTIIIAEDNLANTENESYKENNKQISDDWLYTWKDHVANISDEELQILWGKVLSQEFINPGSIKLRTLNFIKSLSKEEAHLIHKMTPFICDNDFIFNMNYIIRKHYSFADLLLLEELNILSGASIGSLVIEKELSINDSHFFHLNNKKAIRVTNQTTSNVMISLPIIKLTSIGKNLIKMTNQNNDENFFIKSAKEIKQKYPQLIVAFGEYLFQYNSVGDGGSGIIVSETEIK